MWYSSLYFYDGAERSMRRSAGASGVFGLMKGGVLGSVPGQQAGPVQSGLDGQVQQHNADRRHQTVHQGDAARHSGQRLGGGVLLTEDVDVAEVAQQRSVRTVTSRPDAAETVTRAR